MEQSKYHLYLLWASFPTDYLHFSSSNIPPWYSLKHAHDPLRYFKLQTACDHLSCYTIVESFPTLLTLAICSRVLVPFESRISM